MIPDKPRIQQQTQRLPGIRCPHCGNFIPTSIQQILFSSCLFCPTCGLKLNIDKRKSEKALEILKKVDEAQRRVESSSRFSNSANSNDVVNYSDEQLETINNALKDIVFEDDEDTINELMKQVLDEQKRLHPEIYDKPKE